MRSKPRTKNPLNRTGGQGLVAWQRDNDVQAAAEHLEEALQVAGEQRGDEHGVEQRVHLEGCPLDRAEERHLRGCQQSDPLSGETTLMKWLRLISDPVSFCHFFSAGAL